MANPPTEFPGNSLARYEKLVGTIDGLQRKGAANPYTSLNGHMFSFLLPDGSLAIRLSESDRQEFLSRHKTKLVERHGVVMKEYVLVPDRLFRQSKILEAAFRASFDYVGQLKPKATTRKKKSVPRKAAKKVAAKAPSKVKAVGKNSKTAKRTGRQTSKKKP